jgi:hypothetical protein
LLAFDFIDFYALENGDFLALGLKDFKVFGLSVLKFLDFFVFFIETDLHIFFY